MDLGYTAHQSTPNTHVVSPNAPSSLRPKPYRIIDNRRYHPYRRWIPPLPIQNLLDSVYNGGGGENILGNINISVGELPDMLALEEHENRRGEPPDPLELEERLLAVRMEQHRRRILRLANVMVEFVRGLTRGIHT